MVGIDSGPANRTVHLSSIIRAQYANGRIALPQSGGMYSRFKHVQGIPTGDTGAGYSINKLQMIDLLVEHLIRLKGQSAVDSQQKSADPDSLIAAYAGELARSIRSADAVSPSVTAGVAEPGLLFSLVA